MNEFVRDAIALIYAWAPNAPIGTVMDFVEDSQDDFDEGEDCANAFVEKFPQYSIK